MQRIDIPGRSPIRRPREEYGEATGNRQAPALKPSDATSFLNRDGGSAVARPLVKIAAYKLNPPPGKAHLTRAPGRAQVRFRNAPNQGLGRPLVARARRPGHYDCHGAECLWPRTRVHL